MELDQLEFSSKPWTLKDLRLIQALNDPTKYADAFIELFKRRIVGGVWSEEELEELTIDDIGTIADKMQKAVKSEEQQRSWFRKLVGP